jgi:hypothetical protein
MRELDAGKLADGELVEIVHEITPARISISVNGEERAFADGDFADFVAPMHIFHEGSRIAFQSIQAETVGVKPGPVQSLGLAVTPLASGGATRSGAGYTPNGIPTSATRSDSYTQERTRKSQTLLGVDISNLGRAQATAQLEWIFFAGDVKGGKPFVLSRENRRVTIQPAKTERFEIESKEASSRTERQLNIATRDYGDEIVTSSSAAQWREGIALKGWLVRLIADGKVHAIRASAPSYETLARDEAALAQVPSGQPSPGGMLPPMLPR